MRSCQKADITQDPNIIHSITEVDMKQMFRFFPILLLVFISVAAAQHQCDCPMPKELNLTDAQQQQFEKISFDMQKKQIELRAKLETVSLELRRLFTAESIDKSAIEKKMTEVAQQRVALRMNHINAWSEKNKLLNADQQKIWKGMLEHQPRKMMQGRKQGAMMRHGRMDDDMSPRMERRIEKKIITE